MKHGLSILILLSLLVFLVTSSFDGNKKQIPCPVRAFPDAMGFGTETTGGRGGKVIYVTNLNDSGPGSLRYALSSASPRTVLFNVAGTIDLQDDIKIDNPYVTIAGQTAPGEGVQLRGGQIVITTHDVIIRYLKVRSGDARTNSNNDDRDAFSTNHSSAYNIVIDHSTLIWGPDVGGLTFLNGVHDSTVSNSIIGEGLYISNHSKGTAALNGHSMGMNITELSTGEYPVRISVHHNLITTSSDRNPRVIGGKNIDIVNNVIYNWRNSASSGNPRSLNLIKNFYIRGPMTNREETLFGWFPKDEPPGSLRIGSVYENGNIAEGFDTIRGEPQFIYSNTPFTPYSITREDSPTEAYQKIIDDVGANTQVAGINGKFHTKRDRVDRRIIKNLENREGSFINGIDKKGVTRFKVISWPDLDHGVAARDDDQDGMPNAWEYNYFGDTQRGSDGDSSGDFDGDGYTDLEEYLNNTNPTSPELCMQ